jgi:hypothetical protein
MKWRINQNILFFAFLCFFALQVNGQNINEDLGHFREVKTFNAVEVNVIPAKENRIEISGHSKDKVKYQIVEDRLEIRLSLDNFWSNDNTLITVYGNSVETIDANEGSIVQTKGQLQGKLIVLRAQEGAAIFTEVDAESVKLKMVTAGNISIRGEADFQEVEINTGGKLFAKDLKTNRTEITASSGGRGEIYAIEYCKATAKLGGVVEVLGGPDEVDRKTSLGGKILLVE